MRRCRASRVAAWLLCWMPLVAAPACAEEGPSEAAQDLPPPAGKQVDFASDVFPIFQARCNHCHGEESHEGRLRLDAKAIVMAGGQSGPLFKPGDSAASLLIERIAGQGDHERMPLDEDPLSDEEIGVLRAWIDQGAGWPDGLGSGATELPRHWAYVKPERPPLPAVKDPAWCKTPIDHFVLARLEQEGMRPSPEADRARLIRRVSLDLVGLPPTPAEVDEFLADTSGDAYERLVDRLLARPQYGERWARLWLDLARYADSNGYQADQLREVWPYRDWVIAAFNRGMPFDRFTIEQIAGDLLPGATLEQKIATGLHRATTCNVEAGVDPEENRVNQVIDRVNVTGTIWLGTTLECVQCHNHKYDPFTQRDFYGLFAYFNNTPLEVKLESGVQFNFTGPKMELPLEPQAVERRKELQARHAQAKQAYDARADALLPGQTAWEEEQTREGAAEKLPENIQALLKTPADKRNEKQKQQLRDYFLGLDDQVAARRKELDDLKQQLDALQPATTLVMVEMDEPRKTHILRRGDFLDRGPAVEPGTPRILHPLPEDAPPDRLGLAQWLVDPQNPLVGRVTVNRWWAEMFGQGLVATSEDFGTQGQPPTHPELLDWLAVEFVESGWSMKHIHKLIAMSAVYRQASRISPGMLDQDPYNKLLARGPRFRLDAETIRDNALAASGLLSRKMGGPPIFPPQPSGVWRHVGRNAPVFKVSDDDDRYRRGVYVVWRRSAPYVSFVNFDAPDRAAVCDRRPRTNTPLQALTLLNDPVYTEAAKALARRVLTERGQASTGEQIGYAFRLCLAREPSASEREHLQEVYARELARLSESGAPAAALAQGFDLPPEVDRTAWAAWFYLANILLNLDETITKG